MPYAPNEEHQFLIKTATEVLDTMSRLPGMSGEENGAVSANTQVKMRDSARVLKISPRLLKLREAARPTVWIRLPRIRHPKHWDNIDQMVPLARNLCGCGHPLAGLQDWKKSWCKKDGRKY